MFLLDQSSGHGRSREDGLNALNMNKEFGGKQARMRPTLLTDECLGPTPRFNPLETQYMVFREGDDGPFWLSAQEREQSRVARPTDIRKKRDKTNKELEEDLRQVPGFLLTRKLRKKELQVLATRHNIDLKIEIEVTKRGWMNEPKGLLQVLWERGWIDETKLRYYKVPYEKDNDFSLRWLISKCPDFAEEKSAMAHLLDEISRANSFNITLLVTPKYRCELAGEGIEYSWGLSKRFFRKLPLTNKKGRANFLESVRICLAHVDVTHARKFSAKTRRYMLTYAFCAKLPDVECHHNGETLTYSTIERYVKKEFKTHRSTSDQEAGYIAQIYRESIAVRDT